MCAVRLREGWIFGVSTQVRSRWLVTERNAYCRLIIDYDGDRVGPEDDMLYPFTERMLGEKAEEDEAATISYYLFPELLK